MPDVTISLIIITDRERQADPERTRNEKHAQIRSTGARNETGTRKKETTNKNSKRDRARRQTWNAQRREGETRINGVANDGRADKRDN